MDDRRSNKFYCCGYSSNEKDCYIIGKIKDYKGKLVGIENLFEGVQPTELTGYDCNSIFKFSPKRIVVIEMKESEEERKEREVKEQQIRIENQEIFDKHVTNNIKTLEEWSGYQYDIDKSVIFDSDRDGKLNTIFRKKIANHEHLYFIVIDSVNNVFGHYHNSLF